MPLGRVAVLFRTHAVGRTISSELRGRGLRCAPAAADVLSRPDIAPIIGALRLLARPADGAAFRAVAAAAELPPKVIAHVAAEADKRRTSELAAARAVLGAARASLFAPHDPWAAAAGSAGGAAAATTTTGPTESELAEVRSLLEKVDALEARARAEPPHQLVGAILRCGLVASLADREPPYGARLLEEEVRSYRDVYERERARNGSPAGAPPLSAPLGAASQLPGSAMPPPSQPGGRRPADHLGALRAFVEHAALTELEDGAEDNNNGLSLSTIHGAKGREWDAVFVVRVNEEVRPPTRPHLGRLPAASRLHLAQVLPLVGLDDDGSAAGAERIAEERRLLYVAMTRARKRLHVSYVVHTSADAQPLPASRFLGDLPADAAVVSRSQHYDITQPAATFADAGGGAGAQTPGRRYFGTPLKPASAAAAVALPAGRVGDQLAYWQQKQQANLESKSKSAAKKSATKAVTDAAARVASKGKSAIPAKGKGAAAKGAKAKATPAKAASEASGGRQEATASKPAAKPAAPKRQKVRHVALDDDSGSDGEIIGYARPTGAKPPASKAPKKSPVAARTESSGEIVGYSHAMSRAVGARPAEAAAESAESSDDEIIGFARRPRKHKQTT